MNVISTFRGKYAFLSNFYTDAIHVVSVEHKYQAAKATNIVDYLKILNCATAKDAKKESKNISIRSDWKDIRLIVMEQCLIEKFSLPHLKDMLLNTGDVFIVEENDWGDIFYGICDGVGQNNLGKLLMKIRDNFLSQKIKSSISAEDIKIY